MVREILLLTLSLNICTFLPLHELKAMSTVTWTDFQGPTYIAHPQALAPHGLLAQIGDVAESGWSESVHNVSRVPLFLHLITQKKHS